MSSGANTRTPHRSNNSFDILCGALNVSESIAPGHYGNLLSIDMGLIAKDSRGCNLGHTKKSKL